MAQVTYRGPYSALPPMRATTASGTFSVVDPVTGQLLAQSQTPGGAPVPVPPPPSVLGSSSATPWLLIGIGVVALVWWMKRSKTNRKAAEVAVPVAEVAAAAL